MHQLNAIERGPHIVEIEIFREECGNPIKYPLVICYIAMEKLAQLQLIYLLEVVIFNSHVSLPEGIIPKSPFLWVVFQSPSGRCQW